MIKLLGVPFDNNSSFMRGAALAPRRIRAMDHGGAANRYTEDGLEISEGKVYEDEGDMAVSTDPATAFREIREKVASLVPSHRIVSLGGDHSITYPIIDAHRQQYPELHLLQIDAHSDLYDNFAGNAYSHASPFARIMENGLAASLTQVGIRTLTPHQRQQAEKFEVHIIEARAFNLQIADTLQGPLYISLDLDALDPAFAPGVSHHEPGGLSARQVFDLLQRIKIPVIGADIVECNPKRDHHDMTAMLAYKAMKELMGLMHGNSSKSI